MATITTTIPDDKVNDVQDAFATLYLWTAQSGLTKAQFAKKKIADYVKQILGEYKAQQAADAARTANESIIIT